MCDTEGRKMRGWGKKLAHMAYKLSTKKPTLTVTISGEFRCELFSALQQILPPTNLKTMAKWKTF
jgi:hypothetical protein